MFQFLFCNHCGQAFQLPSSLQKNNKIACPQCHHPLIIKQRMAPPTPSPVLSHTVTRVPQEENQKTPLTGSFPTLSSADEMEEILLRPKEGYEVNRILGEGGWGRVYKVQDPLLKRPMALKVLLKKKSSPAMQNRFYREILISSHLDHPNIMPVYEGGYLQDGALYFAMKEIEGGTLKDLLIPTGEKKRQKSLREFLEILLKVCQAIDYAHSRGIIHRDLKPSNLAVGNFGEVIVMDWGLAKKIGEPAEGEGSDRENPEEGDISLAGDMIGTPGYMPPEQANGHHELLGPASDIYSLGAILYHILALSAPFQGGHQKILTTLLLKDPEPPRMRSPHLSIPPALEAIALKALQRSVDDRYTSVNEMVLDLQNYLVDRPISVYTPPFRKRVHRFLRDWSSVLSVLSLVLLVVSILGYLLLIEKQKLLGAKKKKLEAYREKERLVKQKLQAEQKARFEKERKLQAQQKLLSATQKIIQNQRQKERDFQLRLLAYNPYFLARDYMQRSMHFDGLKKVVIPKLQEALKIQPKFIEARWELIKIYIYLGRDQSVLFEVMSLFRLLSKDKKTKQFSTLVFQMMSNPKGFMKDKKKRIQLEKSKPDFLPLQIWIALKVFLFQFAGQYQIALNEVDKILKRPEGKTWDMYLVKVTILQKSSRLDQALALLNTMVRDYPQEIYIHLARAYILKEKKKFRQSWEEFTWVAKVDPSNHIAWYHAGLARREQVDSLIHSSDLQLAYLLSGLRYLQRSELLEPNYLSSKKKIRFSRIDLGRIFHLSPDKILANPIFLNKLFQRAKKSREEELKKEWALLMLSKKNSLSTGSSHRKAALKIVKQYKKCHPSTMDFIWMEGIR